MDSKNSKDLSEIVGKAKKKDDEALSELYSSTHNIAYYTAVSILKNEQDALDTVQDSYIAAFGKLDELEDNAAFLPWLKRIVANNCKNVLKRKNPQLFGSDEEETNTLENIEEQGEDFLPQTYIEQQSKREQIMQIINQLSDVQRASILLFYYDNISIKEISQTMECSESTVTSRISYAKKHIKYEVEALEKKGDKLYSMATTIPFLTKLFTEDAKNHIMSEVATKTILSSTLAASTTTAAATSTTGAAVAAGIFTKFAALSVAGKCIAVGVAAAVIAGGGITVAAIQHNHPQHVPAAVVVSSSVSSNTAAGVDGQVAVKHSDEWLKAQEEAKAKAESAASSSTSNEDVYTKMAEAMKRQGHSDAEIAAEIAELKKYHASNQTGTSSSATTSQPSTTSKPSGTTSQKPATDWGAAEGPIGGGGSNNGSNTVGTGATAAGQGDGYAANSDPKAAIH